eukprot:g7925.t2
MRWIRSNHDVWRAETSKAGLIRLKNRKSIAVATVLADPRLSFQLAQERAHGAPAGEGEDNLDSLLQAVNDDSPGKVPRNPPPGWVASELASYCCWIPVDLPHMILHHFVLFLYSENTRFGHLSIDQLYRPGRWKIGLEISGPVTESQVL